MADEKKHGKKHSFSHTHAEIFSDGSMNIHHVHETDPKKDVKHAVEDLDGLHASMQKHLNPDEEDRLEEEVHPGIHDAIEKLANKA